MARDFLRLRTDAGATETQIATIAGIAPSHYCRIEAGLSNASVETLISVAVALGADVTIRFYPGVGHD